MYFVPILIPVLLLVIFNDVRAAIWIPVAGNRIAVELADNLPTVVCPLTNTAPDAMTPVVLAVSLVLVLLDRYRAPERIVPVEFAVRLEPEPLSMRCFTM